MFKRKSTFPLKFRYTLIGLVAFIAFLLLLPFSNAPSSGLVSVAPFNFKELENSQANSTQHTCSTKGEIEYFFYESSASSADTIKNNKFGLYVYAENRDFIKLADKLVNSNGGDWGYVLLPFNVKDNDHSKWRGVFDLLLKKHLIPIVQLHDVDVNEYERQTKRAAEFLNTFVWPIKQRYISVYNEPNDDKFWYGDADPKEYAKILDFTIDTFKNEHPDFFMINGAFNTSASGGNGYIDAFDFMYSMDKAVPGIFSRLDGWASHAYPQPNFAGSPYATGRWSIRAYEDELNYLHHSLGVTKDLPVFITETGWAHAEGENYDSNFLPVDQIAENFKTAYEHVWLNDSRVQAVTPFTIWFDPPFDHFSWVNKDKVPYAHFEAVKDLKKVKGTPHELKTAKIQVSCPE